MSKYGCGIKVHSGKISHEILCSKHTLAINKVSQNLPKLALKASVVLYESDSQKVWQCGLDILTDLKYVSLAILQVI